MSTPSNFSVDLSIISVRLTFLNGLEHMFFDKYIHSHNPYRVTSKTIFIKQFVVFLLGVILSDS